MPATELAHLATFLPGLEELLQDEDVSEIMINGPRNVWIEKSGRLVPYSAPELDARALERAAIQIARPAGAGPGQRPPS